MEQTLETVTRNEANKLMLDDVKTNLLNSGGCTLGASGLASLGSALHFSAHNPPAEYAAFVAALFMGSVVLSNLSMAYSSVKRYLSNPAQYTQKRHNKRLIE